MKPLDLKVEWLRKLGYQVELRDNMICIYAESLALTVRGNRLHLREGGPRVRALLLHGNPTYRRLRDGLRERVI